MGKIHTQAIVQFRSPLARVSFILLPLLCPNVYEQLVKFPCSFHFFFNFCIIPLHLWLIRRCSRSMITSSKEMCLSGIRSLKARGKSRSSIEKQFIHATKSSGSRIFLLCPPSMCSRFLWTGPGRLQTGGKGHMTGVSVICLLFPPAPEGRKLARKNKGRKEPLFRTAWRRERLPLFVPFSTSSSLPSSPPFPIHSSFFPLALSLVLLVSRGTCGGATAAASAV